MCRFLLFLPAVGILELFCILYPAVNCHDTIRVNSFLHYHKKVLESEKLKISPLKCALYDHIMLHFPFWFSSVNTDCNITNQNISISN